MMKIGLRVKGLLNYAVSSSHMNWELVILILVLHLLSLIHISEPTRLRRISYAVFCLKKKKNKNKTTTKPIGNIQTISSDLFRGPSVGTLAGLAGTIAAVSPMIMNWFIGRITTESYTPAFIAITVSVIFYI